MFNVVGLGGFVVQIGAIALLTRHFGWPAFAATAVALELAALQNFLAHSRWTWTRSGLRPARAAGFAVTGAIKSRRPRRSRRTSPLPRCSIHAGLPAEIANTAAVLACAIPNYLVSERFVFS